MHHDLEIYSIPQDEEPMFINEPWLADKSYSFSEKWDIEPDNLRVYVPIDLNRKAILRLLDEISDGGAECFPFETIDEFRAEFLRLPPVDR